MYGSLFRLHREALLRSGEVIPDEGYASEFFKITTGDLHHQRVHRGRYRSRAVGDLEISLYSPDDKKVVLCDGEGANQGGL